jgi:hypothetical protein
MGVMKNLDAYKWAANVGIGSLVAWVSVQALIGVLGKMADSQSHFIDRVATSNETSAKEASKQTQILGDMRVSSAEISGTNKGILQSQRVTQDMLRSQDRSLNRMADRLEVVLPKKESPEPKMLTAPKK